mmetsp:Transcript_34194/g.79892  ORF Transcript_34194/g.79892 Transcript_34194/m.79892 type:complete len:235 (+) Transcript_34194:493-1197(+)
MSQRQLDHLSDLGHGFLASTNVIIAHVIQALLIFTLHRLTLAVDDCVWSANDELTWVHTNYLELHRPEASADKEGVALPCWSICLQVVWLQICLEQVASDAFHGVVEGQNVDALSVGHITTSMHGDDVAQANAQVLPHNLVHANLLIIKVVISKHNANCVLALLALQQHVVASEEIQLLHLRLREGDHGVVIVERLLHDQAVWRTLLLGCRLCGWGWSCCIVRHHFCWCCVVGG